MSAFTGMPVCAVVDTETSGFSPKRHRVVEVGVCITDAHLTPLSTWHTMVKPNAPVANSHIHGLHDGQLAAAPMFGEIAGTLVAQLHGLRLVAHNAPFDASFLDAEYGRLGTWFCSSPEFSWIDSLALARQHLDGPHKLDALCARFGVTNPRPHTALGDAVSTALMLKALHEHTDDGFIASLEAMQPYCQPESAQLPPQRPLVPRQE